MASTSKLALYYPDTATDGENTFNTDTMLRDNWVKLDNLFHETTGHSHNGTAGQGPKLTSAAFAAGAVNDAALGNRTLDDTTAAAAAAGTLTAKLSQLGFMVKAVTGKANWYTTPAITLEVTKNEIDALKAEFDAGAGHGHTGAAGDGPKLTSAAFAPGAVDDAALGNRTIDDTVAPGTVDTDTPTNLFSKIGAMLRAITGKADWYTAPRTTLENAVKRDGDTMDGAYSLTGTITLKNPTAYVYVEERASGFSQGGLHFLDETATPVTAIGKDGNDMIILGGGVVSGDHNLEFKVGKDGSTWTGGIATFAKQIKAFQTVGPMATATSNLGSIEVRNDGATTSGAFMQFHRSSSWAGYFGLDTDNKWKIGGWSYGANAHEVYHMLNSPASLQINGYQRLASGMIIQWGAAASVPSGTMTAVTFPIAFPNISRSVVATVETSGVFATSVASLTATGFQVAHNDTVARNVRWIAIGY